jgi:hypothetical protein
MTDLKDSSAYPEFSHPGIGGYPDRGTQTGEPVVGRHPATADSGTPADPVLSPGAQDAKADTVAGSGNPASYGLVNIGAIMTSGSSVVGSAAPESISNAQARYHSHQQDTYAQGSQVGAPMDLPEVPTAHSKHVGGDGAGYASG